MRTIIHRLNDWAKEMPQEIAQKSSLLANTAEAPESTKNPRNYSVREMRDQVFYLTLYLEHLGLGAGDVSCILAYNSPEWVHLDLAPGLLGAMSAGLYPNASFKDIEYIFKLTACKVLVVQNYSYYLKATNQGASPLPAHIQMVIVLEDTTGFENSPNQTVPWISYDQAVEVGQGLIRGRNFNDYQDRLNPHQPAFVIFTSGTTGNPKGAMLSHANLASATDLATRAWSLKTRKKNSPMEQLISFLPLCHIAEKLQNLGAGLSLRYQVYYASSIENLGKELPLARPTLLLAVPRVWEKIMEQVEKKMAMAHGPKAVLGKWAITVGKNFSSGLYESAELSLKTLLQKPLADKLVLGKIKKLIGIDRVRVAVSGAAPLPAHVVRWYRALGIEILEVYGMTETAGIISMTPKERDCAGTVGLPVTGINFKLQPDGEITLSGPNVFVGYLHNQAATDEVLKDGRLATGDLGTFDSRGFLKIVGRKKEIIKTSGGKMIAPSPIESQMKANPHVSQACMVGEGRKYLAMLVTLAEGEIPGPAVTDSLEKTKEEINRNLASYEQIKFIKILPRDFSIEQGEMTPTLKMKRSAIEKNFQAEISSLYEND